MILHTVEISLLTKAICFPGSFLCNLLFAVYSAKDLNSFTYSEIIYPQTVICDVLHETGKCF